MSKKYLYLIISLVILSSANNLIAQVDIQTSIQERKKLEAIEQNRNNDFNRRQRLSDSIMWAEVKKDLRTIKVIDGVVEKRTTFERNPAPLPVTREADILWQKMVWRMIDFREKANQHFYYPISEINGRKNLINTLLEAIDNGCVAYTDKITPYEFGTPIERKQIFETIVDLTSQKALYSEKEAIRDVRKLIIKELWYFDKQRSTMQVRILGLCPINIRDSHLSDTGDTIPAKPEKLFWIYFPQIRPFLSKKENLNGFNSARNLSFDDIFLTRRFDGYIIKEENTYNNRAIEDYARFEYAARESDRIKNAIFDYEQDLWEY